MEQLLKTAAFIFFQFFLPTRHDGSLRLSVQSLWQLESSACVAADGEGGSGRGEGCSGLVLGRYDTNSDSCKVQKPEVRLEMLGVK